jgi:glucose uptake protein GlcU
LIVAAFIAFAARNTPQLRWPVWGVVIGNAIWVLDSVLLLLSGSVQPTAIGTAYVIAQAVVVAVIAELEFTGLRKTSRLPQVA